MPSQVSRKRMEGREEKKGPSMNGKLQSSRQIKIPVLNMDEIKQSNMVVSPPPNTQPVTRKSSSGRFNCLCSPTTHAGSFRCRHHRSAGMRHAKSIDSNLSALDSKGSLHPQ